ncbi:MAG TPA: AIR synthase-related protein [Candidatus Sulfotelmatobacter sp.]|nr:AIR synthase-related protein [Candidatus Sulfotelmatobacter sp.]
MSDLNYAASGVDYDLLDLFKRECQRAAAMTGGALARHGLAEPAAVRGESAYLIELPDCYLAHVEEGLGTKNLVADAMLALTGRSHYHAIGVDIVATIVNDVVTSGALPVSVAMHAAVGDAEWFAHAERRRDLAAGFAAGCIQAGAAWGGGETPALRGIVEPGTAVLAGSALGRIAPKSLRIVGDVADGDAIILLAGSGVHANGVTLCRRLAERLPEGYLTPIGDGRSYGEALLAPTVIYAPFVAACQRAGVRLHYAVNITGHGWRKLMRLDAPLVYRIDVVGDPGPLFRFMQGAGPIDDREAYATFNMGAGFAVMVAAADADQVIALAGSVGIGAWHAGRVVHQGGRKAVDIVPLGLAYEAASLGVR